MKSFTKTEHTLQIHGPREQAWRPATDYVSAEARRLVATERFVEAIDAAEVSYIQQYGNMHGVRFRILTVTKAVTFNGAADEEAMNDV